MSSFRLGLIVIAVVTVGLFVVYVVLDPLSQACLAARVDDPSVVCTRHTEFVLVLTLISSALVTLFGTLEKTKGSGFDIAYLDLRCVLRVAARGIIHFFA